MRTTLSIDDDVAKLLNQEIRRSGAPFKQVVNHFLRLGLMAAKRAPGKPFVVHPRKLGLPHGVSYDNIAELLEEIEGPGQR